MKYEMINSVGKEEPEMKTLWELYYTWFKMGLFTFGGGYAMLPMIQREVIDKHHWCSEEEIMDYYAIGQVTPGIIAVNTATFVGYDVKGVPGGIIATLGVISPSIVIITIIAGLITNFSELAVVQSALRGIQVAVCALMFTAVVKLYKNSVKNAVSFVIFAVALVLAYFTNISTVILVIAAGAVGYALSVMRKEKA